jgi:putative AlgH/UPF0301 family transcriptional regulator
MTLSNLMNLRKARPKPEAQPQGDKPQDKKKESFLSSYGFVLLGAALLAISWVFSGAPMQGQHRFLVATVAMSKPELQKKVLFIIRDDRGGALALAVNAPGAKGAPGYGGPVEPEKVFALHSLDVQLPETLPMQDAGIGVLEGADAVAKLKSAKPAPKWYIVVKGYFSWGPRQLEQDITSGSWELVDFDKDVLTSTPAPKLWEATHQLPKLVLTH